MSITVWCPGHPLQFSHVSRCLSWTIRSVFPFSDIWQFRNFYVFEGISFLSLAGDGAVSHQCTYVCLCPSSHGVIFSSAVRLQILFLTTGSVTLWTVLRSALQLLVTCFSFRPRWMGRHASMMTVDCFTHLIRVRSWCSYCDGQDI